MLFFVGCRGSPAPCSRRTCDGLRDSASTTLPVSLARTCRAVADAVQRAVPMLGPSGQRAVVVVVSEVPCLAGVDGRAAAPAGDLPCCDEGGPPLALPLVVSAVPPLRGVPATWHGHPPWCPQ